MNAWIEALLEDPELRAMGHGQRQEDANLGLGWIYYALARALRPRRAVVVGSWRGFVPMVLARALAENAEGGEVVLIEPSLVDGFWTDAQRVHTHWQRFGIANIRHHAVTTQDFAISPACARLRDVGLLFIDGLHTYEQARFDHQAFAACLTSDAVVLFHDSVRIRTSRIYGADRPYQHRVKDYMDELRADASCDVFSLPHADGITLVTRRHG